MKVEERPRMSINAYGLWYFILDGQMHFSTPDLDMRASLPADTGPDEVTPADLYPC